MLKKEKTHVAWFSGSNRAETPLERCQVRTDVVHSSQAPSSADVPEEPMAQLLRRRAAIRFRRGSLSRVAGPRKVDKLTLYITGPVTGGYPVRAEVQIPLCRVAPGYHMWLVAGSSSSVVLSSGVPRTRPAGVFSVSVVSSEHKVHAQEDGTLTGTPLF